MARHVDAQALTSSAHSTLNKHVTCIEYQDSTGLFHDRGIAKKKSPLAIPTSGLVPRALLKPDKQDHTMLAHSKSESHHFVRLNVGPILLEDLCAHAHGTAVSSLFGND